MYMNRSFIHSLIQSTEYLLNVRVVLGISLLAWIASQCKQLLRKAFRITGVHQMDRTQIVASVGGRD